MKSATLLAALFGFLGGILVLPSCALVAKLAERTREFIRTKRGIPCPTCHDDGYIEDVDIESRSVSRWPCSCAKGRAFAAKLKSTP